MMCKRIRSGWNVVLRAGKGSAFPDPPDQTMPLQLQPRDFDHGAAVHHHLQPL